MCEFDLSNELNGIPALATFNAVHGQHLLRFNQSEEITAVLTVKVGLAVELLFVAYSNSSSSGHFVDKVDYLCCLSQRKRVLTCSTVFNVWSVGS